MNEFVQKLKEDGRFLDAYLVAKNLLSKEIKNTSLFLQYIDLALEIASYEIMFDERREYLQDASSALVLYSEAADIDDDCLTLIKETKEKINCAYHDVLTAEQSYLDKINQQAEDDNTKLLGELGEIYEKLDSSQSQEQFDEILLKVSDVDGQLQKNIFTSTQENSYTTLTKGYSEAISTKMDELNKKALLSYNKRAVKCFDKVLQTFRENPSKCIKNESNLKALMTSQFFVFDTSKLFNESLIFYNHVYTVVFQGADDSMKFKLTEWALNTAKTAK